MKKINRWKGFVLGGIESIIGLVAMDFYWKRAAPGFLNNFRTPSLKMSGDSTTQ